MISLAFLTACGGEEKKSVDAAQENVTESSTEVVAKSEGQAETPESIAAKWCELNGKAYMAATPEDKEAAKSERTAYEKLIESKYMVDTLMMEKIEAAFEACESSSEGR